MALRSVLDIQVNDGAFQDYKRAFDDYTKLVKGLPSDFAKSWDIIQKQRNAFNEMTAKMVARNFLEKQRVAAQKEADRLTKSQSDHWREIARSSKIFAANISSVTLSVLKWAGPIGIMTGLLGAAGGLFGLDHLAGAVAGQRRNSMGLGIRYGQGQAFRLDYGRFVDASSVLSNVSGGLYDATSPAYTALLAAGLKQSFMQSHNAADVSRELLHRLPDIFSGTPRELVGAKAHALGIDQLISSQDIIRYLNASPAERSAQDSAYSRDARTFGLGAGSQLLWQNFLTSLDRAGQGIQATFVRGLTPLTGPLQKLSAAFDNAVEAFLASDAVKLAIKGITLGLDRFANYVGTPQFQQDLRNFVDGISYAAHKIIEAMHWLGLLPDRATPAGAADIKVVPTDPRANAAARDRFLGTTGTHGADARDPSPGKNFWWQHGKSVLPALAVPPGYPSSWGGAGSSTGAPTLGDREKFIRSYATSVGIDPNVALWVAKHEGFGGKTGDYGTSGGDYQLHYALNHRGVGDQYTAATGHDSRDQKYWREQDKFALDWARRHGWGDWSSMRGQDPYVGIGASPTVRIDNNTGGNTIISTNSAVNN